MHSGVDVTIYDSPGLQDGTCKDESYLDQMSKALDVANLILYCFDMTTTRWLPADQNAIELITKRFGMTFWSKSILVLTKANQFQLSKRYSDPAKISEWEKTCEQAFNDIADPFKAQLNGLLPSTEHSKVDNIPVIAAGSCEREPKERELIFVAPGKTHMDYLSELWVQCLKRLPPDESRLSFLLATDFQSVKVSPTLDNSSIKINIQKLLDVASKISAYQTPTSISSTVMDSATSIGKSLEIPNPADRSSTKDINSASTPMPGTAGPSTLKPQKPFVAPEPNIADENTCASSTQASTSMPDAMARNHRTTRSTCTSKPLVANSSTHTLPALMPGSCTISGNSRHARPKSKGKPAVAHELNSAVGDTSSTQVSEPVLQVGRDKKQSRSKSACGKPPVVHKSNTAIGSSSRVSAPKVVRNHRRAKSTPTSITDAGTTTGNTNSDLNCSETVSSPVNPRSRKLELDPFQSVAVSDLTNESLMSITKRFAAVGADIGATIGAATAKHVPKLRPDAQGTVGTIVGGVVGGTVGAVVGLAVGLWKKWWV